MSYAPIAPTTPLPYDDMPLPAPRNRRITTTRTPPPPRSIFSQDFLKGCPCAAKSGRGYCPNVPFCRRRIGNFDPCAAAKAADLLAYLRANFARLIGEVRERLVRQLFVWVCCMGHQGNVERCVGGAVKDFEEKMGVFRGVGRDELGALRVVNGGGTSELASAAELSADTGRFVRTGSASQSCPVPGAYPPSQSCGTESGAATCGLEEGFGRMALV